MVNEKREKNGEGGEQQQQPVPLEKSLGFVYTFGGVWLVPDHNLKLFRNHSLTERDHFQTALLHYLYTRV